MVLSCGASTFAVVAAVCSALFAFAVVAAVCSALSKTSKCSRLASIYASLATFASPSGLGLSPPFFLDTSLSSSVRCCAVFLASNFRNFLLAVTPGVSANKPPPGPTFIPTSDGSVARRAATSGSTGVAPVPTLPVPFGRRPTGTSFGRGASAVP